MSSTSGSGHLARVPTSSTKARSGGVSARPARVTSETVRRGGGGSIASTTSKPEARSGWAGEVHKPQIHVEFQPAALEILQKWMSESARPELKDVIVELIQQDPRPVVYRGYEDGESPYRNKHAFRLYEGDIHFEFTSPTSAQVIDIRF